MDNQKVGAIKRIPVEAETWANLSKLKEPGETYDVLLNRLMEIEAGLRLAHELQKLELDGRFEEFS
jgi:hypothetical protein